MRKLCSAQGRLTSNLSFFITAAEGAGAGLGTEGAGAFFLVDPDGGWEVGFNCREVDGSLSNNPSITSHSLQ